MDDDGARGGLVRVGCLLGRAVLEVEALGELEVELDGRALERPAEGVANLDVDLGAVERAVARIELPLARVLRLEGLLQLLQKDLRVSDIRGKDAKARTSSAKFQVSMSPR